MHQESSICIVMLISNANIPILILKLLKQLGMNGLFSDIVAAVHR
jgi:hypothetical protein